MANYEIHIQDVENSADDLILHYAERDAIELNWLGGDSKTQPIVGSELNFSLEAGDARDAAFIELFTLDEKKWLVSLRISDNQELVWQGYVLPESYREPYRNAIFYVEVSAVDGLGLLKGVKLPDDFYVQEKSVMQVLCAILKLTKVDLELFFSPAIINSNEPDWNKIYVDTALWDRKDDNAYELLKDLMDSMRCQVFQCQGRWYIEGFNKKQLIEVTYEVYNLDGQYLKNETIEKNVKQIPFLATPEVTMVPGIREAVITYERNPLEFAEDIVQETDVPWINYTGSTDQRWFPQHWNYDVDEFVTMGPPENLLVYRNFNHNPENEIDFTRFITTRDRYYVRANTTVKINMRLQVYLVDDISEEALTDTVINNWQNRQIYEVRLDNDVIFTNYNISNNDQGYLKYEDNGDAELELILRIENDGLLDLKFYQPYGSVVDTQYRGTKFKELNIEILPEINDEVYVINNTELGSNVSDLTIRFGDDPTLFANAFYLEKRRIFDTALSRMWFEVFFYKVIDGQQYAIIPIRAAALAYRLRFETSRIYHVNSANATTGEILDNPEIIFNYENGEGHAIAVNEELTNGHILINYAIYKDQTQSRLKNTEWTDALIGVQKERYGQIVGEVEKKIYETPHFTFECSTDSPVKFNDIIKRKYFGEDRYFSPSNLSWRPDNNTSDITMNELLYSGVNSDLIPPFVDAGPDITMGVNDSVTFLSAVASAPSGTIENVQWTIITADDSINIISPSNLDTEVDSLDTDFYTFRITVTDSNGLTAFDEVNVIRVSESILFLDELSREEDQSYDGFEESKEFLYELKIDPDFEAGQQLSLKFFVFIGLFTNNPNQPPNLFSQVEINKNGTEIFNFRFTQNSLEGSSLDYSSGEVRLSFDSNDVITIRFILRTEVIGTIDNESASSDAIIRFTEVVSGSDIALSNLPLERKLSTRASS